MILFELELISVLIGIIIGGMLLLSVMSLKALINGQKQQKKLMEMKI